MTTRLERREINKKMYNDVVAQVLQTGEVINLTTLYPQYSETYTISYFNKIVKNQCDSDSNPLIHYISRQKSGTYVAPKDILFDKKNSESKLNEIIEISQDDIRHCVDENGVTYNGILVDINIEDEEDWEKLEIIPSMFKESGFTDTYECYIKTSDIFGKQYLQVTVSDFIYIYSIE